MKYFSYEERTEPCVTYQEFHLFVLGEDHEEMSGPDEIIQVSLKKFNTTTAKCDTLDTKEGRVSDFYASLWDRLKTPIERVGAEEMVKHTTEIFLSRKKEYAIKLAKRQEIFDRFMSDYQEAIQVSEKSGIVFSILQDDQKTYQGKIIIKAEISGKVDSAFIYSTKVGLVRLGDYGKYSPNISNKDILVFLFKTLFYERA